MPGQGETDKIPHPRGPYSLVGGGFSGSSIHHLDDIFCEEVGGSQAGEGGMRMLCRALRF